jgi:hypothetical protein
MEAEMRRRVLLALSVVGLLGTSVPAADKGEKSCCKNRGACASMAAEGSSKLRCSLTGNVVDSCCCVQREGKLYCTLAKKNVDSCCCESASKASGAAGEASKGEAPGRSLP